MSRWQMGGQGAGARLGPLAFPASLLLPSLLHPHTPAALLLPAPVPATHSSLRGPPAPAMGGEGELQVLPGRLGSALLSRTSAARVAAASCCSSPATLARSAAASSAGTSPIASGESSRCTSSVTGLSSVGTRPLLRPAPAPPPLLLPPGLPRAEAIEGRAAAARAAGSSPAGRRAAAEAIDGRAEPGGAPMPAAPAAAPMGELGRPLAEAEGGAPPAAAAADERRAECTAARTSGTAAAIVATASVGRGDTLLLPPLPGAAEPGEATPAGEGEAAAGGACWKEPALRVRESGGMGGTAGASTSGTAGAAAAAGGGGGGGGGADDLRGEESKVSPFSPARARASSSSMACSSSRSAARAASATCAAATRESSPS